MKLIFAFCFSLLILGVSCKKDTVVETRSVLELLTNNSSKTWQVKEGFAKQGDVEVNLIASQNPCVTDNQIVLGSDFSYSFLEGASKCSPDDPDLILKATWQLASDESSITIDRFIFLGRTIEKPTFILSSVTEATFSGTTTITLNGETFEVTVTFERI